MSIYATILSIEDVRQVAERLGAQGIQYGVIGELGVEDMDAPIVYEGSHVLPSDTDRRGGGLDLAEIPDHVTRDGRDDAPEGALKDWLRLSVWEAGGPYVRGGDATVVLTRVQAERLRNALTAWLEREPEGIE